MGNVNMSNQAVMPKFMVNFIEYFDIYIVTCRKI